MTPPTIAAVLDLLCGDEFLLVTVPLGFMLSTGALREDPSQPSKNRKIGLHQLQS